MKTPLAVGRGEGAYLIDESGKSYLDATSSWWTNIHGHAHPYFAEKIYKQALQLEHVIFAGCTHEPAVQLAERILPTLPGDFARVFYSDNGSTAVEVALKMAIQYSRNKEQGTRNKIMALKDAYHGDTFGAMSVSERGVFTMAFGDYLFEVNFVDAEDLEPNEIPWNEIACFIYEPLVQGAGGMKMNSPEQLDRLISQCRKNKIICIADEVMTGFYRTGKCFASEYLSQQPDIICLSKALTGGTLPLAITACTPSVFDAFLSDDIGQTFFHGHSFTANPLACAAALASLDLLEKKECMDQVNYIAHAHRNFIQKISGSDGILNPRSCGTILAFELNTGASGYTNSIKEEVAALALQNGVFLRPLGNTVYIMPPYCISREALDHLYSVLEQIIAIIKL